MGSAVSELDLRLQGIAVVFLQHLLLRGGSEAEIRSPRFLHLIAPCADERFLQKQQRTPPQSCCRSEPDHRSCCQQRRSMAAWRLEIHIRTTTVRGWRGSRAYVTLFKQQCLASVKSKHCQLFRLVCASHSCFFCGSSFHRGASVSQVPMVSLQYVAPQKYLTTLVSFEAGGNCFVSRETL